MGMFDTIYAELDCPFCGRQYRHTPLSREQAERECEEWEARELEHTRPLQGAWDDFIRHTQIFRARVDGFIVREGEQEQQDILAWIEQLDSPENIERWRTRKEPGLAEIQTRAFDLGALFHRRSLPLYGLQTKGRERIRKGLDRDRGTPDQSDIDA